MKLMITQILVLCFISLPVFAADEITPKIPDTNATPGSLCSKSDPDFSRFKYKERVPFCVRNVSPFTKDEVYEYYHIPASLRRNYTIDHFIPLSIGGNNQKTNLWPEHKKLKKLRPDLETDVFEAVRDGKITQEEAIAEVIKAKMNPPLSRNLNFN